MPDQSKHSTARSLESESEDIESASRDSFPASDPPPWGSLRLGPPVHSELPPDATQKKAPGSADRST